jgi:hypothetical protein
MILQYQAFVRKHEDALDTLATASGVEIPCEEHHETTPMTRGQEKTGMKVAAKMRLYEQEHPEFLTLPPTARHKRGVGS